MDNEQDNKPKNTEEVFAMLDKLLGPAKRQVPVNDALFEEQTKKAFAPFIKDDRLNHNIIKAYNDIYPILCKNVGIDKCMELNIVAGMIIMNMMKQEAATQGMCDCPKCIMNSLYYFFKYMCYNFNYKIEVIEDHVQH